MRKLNDPDPTKIVAALPVAPLSDQNGPKQQTAKKVPVKGRKKVEEKKNDEEEKKEEEKKEETKATAIDEPYKGVCKLFLPKPFTDHTINNCSRITKYIEVTAWELL
jgi:hypothetical protein